MSGHGKKLLSTEALAEASFDIAVAAKEQGERVALVGGYALQLYGSLRLTADLDVLAEHPLVEFQSTKPLTFGGYQTVTASKVPVDVIIRDDAYAPLYEAALNTASRMRGVPILVAKIEFIAAMKFAAGRSKDNADLEFIITETPIDLKKTDKILSKYLGIYAVDEFQNLVAEVQWKKSRGKL